MHGRFFFSLKMASAPVVYFGTLKVLRYLSDRSLIKSGKKSSFSDNNGMVSHRSKIN